MGPHQHQPPPPRRRGWLRRNWPWYDRYCTARDARRYHQQQHQQRRGRSRNNDSDGGCDFCDGCGCDLFHLSMFQVLLLTTPRTAPRPKPSVPARVGVSAIRGYQRWVSRATPCCPQTPSCSHYGLAVVRRYGLLQGARLAGGRIARCTPGISRGSADPPP